MKSVLMVLAHPDDEILFGWPIFFDRSIERMVLMCSTDKENAQRQWCSHRSLALQEVCRREGAGLRMIDNPSSFYGTQTRRPAGFSIGEHGDSQAPFRSMCNQIRSEITALQENVDCIFVHNPYGEYGHSDHKLLFDIVLKTAKKPIMFTDIIHPSNWSYESLQSAKESIAWKLYYHNQVSSHKLDVERFSKYAELYKNSGCWTWSREITSECSLYLIDRQG